MDDFFIIGKEKYVKDLNIISYFQSMNEYLPIEYLRRNHLQYEFVSYVSMVGTLFISKHYEGAGRFILRAYSNLESINNIKFNDDYLKKAKEFLEIIKVCLINDNLVSENLKQELIEN